MHFVARLMPVAALALLIACKSGSGDPVQPLPDSGTMASGGGYPAGPYGSVVGKTIRNYQFEGYRDPSAGFGSDHVVEFALGDFFNPTADATYGPGELFPEGEPKPLALMINVGATWCAPCQQEARDILPGEYAALKPRGMELLMILAESADPGEVADLVNLDNWVEVFEVNYPSAIDPTRQLADIASPEQFPANVIVDTRDMAIKEVVTGIPKQSFFDKLEQLLEPTE